MTRFAAPGRTANITHHPTSAYRGRRQSRRAGGATMPQPDPVAVDSAPLLDRLTRDGTLSRPLRSTRPTASDAKRVSATRPVSDLVSEQRR
ncbi:MAG: hypothetical protein BGO26_19175 [Actinobacteria bacterium 69-20]|nr:MAG: hypothetical protein BGO26_19175 [Actinobacteria bacterium 69-20]